ncbi:MULTISPECIES: protein phosphatase [unclassified Gemella]|nr:MULTISPECIES: protein phosphatase [unclassified Gemella]MBF0709689.1 protein phosphatase [Gemella sp. GL1.1]MBF0746892.1 protein phosphatase [Gemella sp. 19428wG2_WT2a]
MENEMNLSELLKELAEENQTRKILEILKESESLEEAIKKIEALLK